MLWMLKLAGAALVFCCGSLLGMRKSELAVARAEYLCDMHKLLLALQNAITFRVMPTAEALQTVSQVPYQRLVFTPLQGESTAELQAHFCLQMREQLQGIVTKHDAAPFLTLLQTIGQETAAEETQKLHYAIAQTQQAMELAQRDAQAQRKLYRSLGMAGGAAMALLLL